MMMEMTNLHLNFILVYNSKNKFIQIFILKIEPGSSTSIHVTDIVEVGSDLITRIFINKNK